MTTAVKGCKDCAAEGITTKRKLATDKDGGLMPGPRCVTHWRAEKRRRRLHASQHRVEVVYDMPAETYDAILEHQGGRCAVCQIANGTTKRLAVEHAHNLPGCEHPPEKGCARCWRGICCGRCNELLARFTPDQLLRAIRYLYDPPAQQLLRATMEIVDDAEFTP
jgi:hypothetical protein